MRSILATVSIIGLIQLLATWPATSSAQVVCTRTVTANVVAIDQPIMFNRLGAQNPNGMMYALRRDVVDKATGKPESAGGTLSHGNVELRPDKRPRPLVLRVAAGDCLTVTFQNLLDPVANPNPSPHPTLAVDNQVADRHAGFHVQGLQLVNDIASDSSYVGDNANSLAAPGDSRTYTYFAPHEGTFLVTSYGATFGGIGNIGNTGNGLFGAVNVEPTGANFYRSQLTEEEFRLATVGMAGVTGLPIIDYHALYPNAEPWITEGKAGRPILAMLTPASELVHSDLNAIIVGNATSAGRFPASAYPLELVGNPSIPNRLEPFREFTVILHDTVAAAQAFPGWFEDPVLRHTFRGTRDDSMINYAAAGAGSAVIANRLGVGPMHDCLTCAYEEFFTSAFAVGDPGILVDVPANSLLEQCSPSSTDCGMNFGPKAERAFYPDDPSNVHHSYLGDFVKIRNLNAGANDSHSFHVSGHQWLANANDDNSRVVDTQSVGPGAGLTYEIGFGGAGNRNKTVGDALMRSNDGHFVRGMWSIWRIHDTFEKGTELAVDGKPASNARALPDGEIIAGTPIPAVVPLPGKALAPMPGTVTVVGKDADGDGIPDSSQANVDPSKNPGFPFWVAGIEHTVGQRSTTPPLDLVNDGGLPRHTLHGYRAGGTTTHEILSRLDFNKIIEQARPEYFPEDGTDVEKAAMAFHAQRRHPSIVLNLDGSVIGDDPGEEQPNFITNGAPSIPGAPFSDPCMDDLGELLNTSNTSGQNPGFFFDGTGGLNVTGIAGFGADQPREYRSASIQLDAVLNKVGYHFPQQRIFSLRDDARDFIDKARAPEPLVTRLNTFDCATYLHTNLVPHTYERDDYQVGTPTDIVGQHPSLLKHDLVASGGTASGWNYEDGSLSPSAVHERIVAINAWQMINQPGEALLVAEPHPFYGPGTDGEWLGARTTVQRWFADPVTNVEDVERGLGAATVSDQFSPSTSQPTGLTAAVLTEPAGSTWKNNESGEPLNDYTVREDGGPTSWQAIIDATGDNSEPLVFREFYLSYNNTQRAYETGVYVGAGPDGRPVHSVPDPGSYRSAINPPHRQDAAPVFPDLFAFPAACPGGVPRPCPIAGASDADGMLSVNYRNEPLALRVYDPDAAGPDGVPGTQAAGLAGDLSFALVTSTIDADGIETPLDRAMPALNQQPDVSTSFDLGESFPFPPPLQAAGAALPTDPYTPMLRVYQGDPVRLTVQGAGHNATVHGVKWLQGGSLAGNSGWRNAQGSGDVDQLSFSSPIDRAPKAIRGSTDHLYSVDASEDGFWSGVWGLLRAYDEVQAGLAALATNPDPKPSRILNRQDFNGVCPAAAPFRAYDIAAVLANELLPNAFGATIVPSGDQATRHVGAALDPDGGTLVYNSRKQPLTNPNPSTPATAEGPLHDPTAILLVNASDLTPVPGQRGGACRDTRGRLGVLNPECEVMLRPGFETEPAVLRAAAGECIEVTLHSRLPEIMPDLAGFRMLRGIVNRNRSASGMTTFNNNLIRPSSHVGLHAQLVEYDVSRDNGVNVGVNVTQTVGPVTVDTTGARKAGKSVTYLWYAGDIEQDPGINNSVSLVATPVEFGGTNLTPADVIKQGQKGLLAALVVVPQGSVWADDVTGATSATVTSPSGLTARDFVAIAQKGLNLRFSDGGAAASPHTGIYGEPVASSRSGQQALNYRSEPVWFRFGLLPESTLGYPGLGGVSNAHEAYSNGLPTDSYRLPNGDPGPTGDPETPVFIAPAGAPLKMHLLQSAGGGQISVFALHGHEVPNEPYVKLDVSSQAMGDNPFQEYAGAQRGLGPMGHFDLLIPSAGGANELSGDYLFRDQAADGNFQGLWGLLRVDP